MPPPRQHHQPPRSGFTWHLQDSSSCRAGRSSPGPACPAEAKKPWSLQGRAPEAVLKPAGLEGELSAGPRAAQGKSSCVASMLPSQAPSWRWEQRLRGGRFPARHKPETRAGTERKGTSRAGQRAPGAQWCSPASVRQAGGKVLAHVQPPPGLSKSGEKSARSGSAPEMGTWAGWRNGSV